MSTTESEAENLDGEQKSLLAENKWGKRSKKDIPNRLQLFAEYSFLITKSKIYDSLFFSQSKQPNFHHSLKNRKIRNVFLESKDDLVFQGMIDNIC